MSPARLAAARYAEASWLLVAVWAALLFQVIAQRSFDFPRVAWLLALLPWALAAGWLALRGERAPRLPVALAAALLASYALSTALSIAPTVSLWGSRFNAEGLIAAIGYTGVFLLVALLMRRPEQARRLVDVVLLASVPVSLYGIVQYFGLDPLAAAMSQQIAGGRIVSSLGNPILAGGYAAIVVPLTVARLVEAWRGQARRADDAVSIDDASSDDPRGGRRREHPAPPGRGGAAGAAAPLVAAILGLAAYLWLAARSPPLWWAAPAVLGVFLAALLAARWAPSRREALLGYGALLLLQVTLVVLARSRGPFVALPVALGVTLLLLAHTRRARLGLVAAGVVGALVVLGLVVAPALRGDGGTVSSRWLIWQSVVDLSLRGHDVGVPSDPLAGVRPLIGRGPETLAMAYERVATAEARRAESFRISRAHDEPLDVLATRGLLGLVSWLFALGAIGWSLWQAWRRDAPGRATLAGAAGGLTAYLVAHLFEPTDPALALHFWLLAGLAMSPAARDGLAASPAARDSAAAAASAAGPRGESAGREKRAGRGGRARATAAARRPGADATAPAGAGWPAGAVLGGAALAIALLALADVGLDVVGLLLIVWLALAPLALSGGFAAVRWRAVLPVGLLAFALSWVVVRRFEADVFSKFGLDATRRGDVASGLELTREAVDLAPDDELLRSNVARVLTAAANAAPDRPPRPDLRPTWDLIEQLPSDGLRAYSKRELLLLAVAALDEAVARAPAEPDNRLNLAILHRALGDLGEPGHHARAREQLRTLTAMGPTQEMYPRLLAELDGR